MNLNLKGKKAVVCGSSQGIGWATAMELASMGASIVLVARNEDKLSKLISKLPNDDQEHSYLVADFNKPNSLAEVISEWAANNKAHILINNTGGPPAGTALSAEIEAYRLAFNQHLICNQILVQNLAPGMKNAGYGRIINVISTSVKQPLANLGVSNTIRGAVANWSKTLANELGEFGITVNNVLPGATATGRLDAIIENKAKNSGKTQDQVAHDMASQVPAKRVGQPNEVAMAIAFLASPSASYINGVNLPVDGGRTKSL